MILSATAQKVVSRHPENCSVTRKFVLRRNPPCQRLPWLHARGVRQEAADPMSVAGISAIEAESRRILACVLMEDAGCVLDFSYACGREPLKIDHPFIEGRGDALVVSGEPEAPKALHILCVNTDPDMAQVLLYLSRSQYPWVFGHCDRILLVTLGDVVFNTERLHYDEAHAIQLYWSLMEAVESEDIPPMPQDTSVCHGCRYEAFCHGREHLSSFTCRTCAFSSLKEDGTWHCDMVDRDLEDDMADREWECHSIRPCLANGLENVRERNINGALCFKDVYSGRIVYNGSRGVPSRNVYAMLDMSDAFEGEIWYGV